MQGISSLSASSTQAPLTFSQQGGTQVVGAVRMAPTVVTNAVRPIASTPIPIASKPAEGAVALSSLPQDKKATLLIGGGGGGGGPQQLPITAGGGYPSSSSSSSSSSPGPLVTSLVLGGSFPTAAAQTVQLQTPLPVITPQLRPLTANTATATTSPLTPPKPIAQVQYILPTNTDSPSQILSLPANAALANGVHSGVGLRVASVSPGTRGETEIKDRPREGKEQTQFLFLVCFHWTTENRRKISCLFLSLPSLFFFFLLLVKHLHGKTLKIDLIGLHKGK